MSEKDELSGEHSYDPLIFWGSTAVILLFILWSILFPQAMERVVNRVFTWTTEGWGWLYLVTVFALVISSFVLMITKYGVFVAVFAIAQNLPLTGVLAVVLLFLIATFFLTSANSATLALSMFVSGQANPGRKMRAFWGIALGGVAAVLAGTGNLVVIQTASIATAFPVVFLLIALLLGTFRGLNAYWKDHELDQGE